MDDEIKKEGTIFMSYGMSKYDFKFLRKTNNDFITQSIRVISKF